ncbi:protein-S-isoprenylcysteine O-methyltransferase [Rhizoctonia solani]|uniref:Protein-S-isoprenylcysteine O-methyltransferase n=1 Tax=Rhizoctonia solani TaxID=456999 RepID=A0A0K6FS35_9AGAM|nr:protein-S-isoprenylcysteine O-methyltransferase [Rhizoctonia solani]
MESGSASTDIPHPPLPRRTTNGFTMPDPPTNPLETVPTHAHQVPHNNIPNTPLSVATVSAGLGILFTLGAGLFVSGGVAGSWWATYQLGFFMAVWSFFHWAEFAVTAGWNREKLSVDSFLLDNGMTYHIAHATALTEFFVTKFFFPDSKSRTTVSMIGIVMVIIGQTIRSLAMIHASSNFSHTVATYKLVTHRLVTDGIYSISRHPSYAGFFYWGLGTQLVLQNPVTFVL